MLMVKELGLALAASFAMSAVALAEDAVTKKQSAAPNASRAVQLSDAQLDEITAGEAVHFVVVFNPGNAEVQKGDLTGLSNFLCINCPLFGGGGGDKASGAVVVINRGHPEGMIHFIGGTP